MASANTQIFALSGAVGLKNAPELVERLRAAIVQSEALVIDAEGLDSLDVAALQLLVSAHKSALLQGKSVSLRRPPTGVLREALARAGFIDAQGRALAPAGALWQPDSTTHGART